LFNQTPSERHTLSTTSFGYKAGVRSIGTALLPTHSISNTAQCFAACQTNAPGRDHAVRAYICVLTSLLMAMYIQTEVCLCCCVLVIQSVCGRHFH
jgi:hypothetical protein